MCLTGNGSVHHAVVAVLAIGNRGQQKPRKHLALVLLVLAVVVLRSRSLLPPFVALDVSLMKSMRWMAL